MCVSLNSSKQCSVVVAVGSSSKRTHALRRSLVCHATRSRRQLLQSLVAAPLLVSAVAFAEEAPAAGQLGGNCPTCLGPVDGTLGSCAGLKPCSSSYDDRPPHFVAPWQFDGSQAAALRALVAALQDLGASVQEQTDDYVYATWSLSGPTTTGLVDMEFLFAANDNTVAVRAAPQQQLSSSTSILPVSSSSPFQTTLLSLFGSKPDQLLDNVRMQLGWEEVPILRNRKRLLLFGESPFDDFGPVPPSGLDYGKDLLGDF